MKRFYSLILSAVTFLFFAGVLSAQERTVTGTVIDTDDNPVIGAAVIVSGTTTAVITDLDGNFSIDVPSDASMLNISCIGYKSMDVSISGRDRVDVTMEIDNILLDEAVAIGYGTTKRGNLSGAIAKVDADKLESRDNVNIGTALQGMLSGVEVRSNSGAPGSSVSISIRGVASVNAEAEPLYVVDGVPVDDISDLNPADIASIEALKDASSAAIYGSRGANGVILITTKMPEKEQPTRVNVNVSWGVQTLERKADVMTPEEWINFRTRQNNANYVEAFGHLGATENDDYETRLQYSSFNPRYFNDPRWSMPDYAGLMLIDWQDEFFRPALLQNYQLAVSGSTSKTSYRISAGYVNQDGIATNSNFNRLNMVARVQTKMLRDRLTVGFDLKPSISKKNGADVDGKDNAATKVLQMCPVAEPESGLWTNSEGHPVYEWGSSSAVSPYAYMNEITQTNSDINLVTSAFLEARIMEGWVFNVTGSYTYRATENHRFIPSSIVSGWDRYDEGYRATGRRRNNHTEKYLLQATTNFDREFGAHGISAMAGASLEGNSGSSSLLSASQFPNNYLITFNYADEVLTDAEATYAMSNRLISAFGRVQYAYDDRYIVLASIRADGSSRLGADNRWGIFPAASVAWRVSKEPFWSDTFFMNELKFRASYGVNGNNRISNTAALNLLGSANYSSDGGVVNGYAPQGIENRDLGWERTTSWNVGLDMGFWDNRLLISAEYYDKLTNDLLYQVSVPGTLGQAKYWDNVGSIRNRGVELELTSHNIDNGNFSWTTVFNLSYNKNVVESLGDDNSTIYGGWSDSMTQVLKVGEPIGAYYMYDAVGVYQTSDDLKYYPVMRNSIVGDIRFRDANEDGVIDDDDRTIVGKPSPDFVYGLTNTFRWKRWEFSFLLTAQTGGMIYSTLGRSIDVPKTNLGTNMMACWENMWVSESNPGDGRTPGISNLNTASLYNTRWLYSTDFIKIKNMSLSYRFKFKKNSLVRNLKLYINAENLYMWDKYKGGFSPESNNGNLLQAYDYGAYPQARVISFGANITF